MTLPIQRYTRRPEVVEAVQVTAENMDEVAAWCGEDVFHSIAEPVIHVDDSERGYGGTAHAGDWVIRHDHGLFTIQPDQDDGWSAGFHDTWMPAAPSTAQVTEYRFRPVPLSDDQPDAWLWTVYVRQHGDEWAVVAGSVMACTREGEWVDDYGHRGGHKWRVRHLMPEAEALALAERAQWTLVANGKTAADVLAERGPEDGGAPA